MTNLLVINSSINLENGNSTKLTTHFVDTYENQGGNKPIIRDLGANPLPHLDGKEMQAWMTAEEDRTAEQQSLASLSDDVITEVQNADVIVVGVPMYNFGVPSNFKAWIDRLARAGVTFKYTETGPVGLLNDKKVIILAARGGVYAGTDADSQSAYLKNFFAFLGLTDVEFVYAEGLAMGEGAFKNAWDNATTKINQKILELNGKSAA